MEAYMSQITLRKIPPAIEKKLRMQARRSGVSLNKMAISLLSRGLGEKDRPASGRRRDLSRFSGTLTQKDLEEFNANTAFFSRIDPEMWKS